MCSKSRFILSLSLAAALCFAVNAPAAGSDREPPSFHYVFAHQYLPSAIYADPDLGLALAIMSDKSEFLLNVWEFCRHKLPQFEKGTDPTGLAIEAGKVDGNTAYALITMPRPQAMPEAYYIMIITNYRLEAGSLAHIEGTAYYTLEKSIELFPSDEDGPGGKAKAIPTVIGSWDAERRHGNHGPGPAPDSPEEFMAAVLKLYTRKAR